MLNSNRLLWVLMLLGCAAVVNTSQGDEPATAPAVRTAVIGRVAVGSAKQINDLAADLEIPLPKVLSLGTVEQMLPFLGQGSLSPDLPLTVDFVAGAADLSQNQRALFYLPMMTGKVPIGDLLANGGEKFGDDGAIIGGSPFRRTGDYLMFGSTPEMIRQINPAEMIKDLSNRPLLYLSFDAAKLREVEPELLEKFNRSLRESSAKTGSPDETAGQNVVYDFIAHGFDKLVFWVDRGNDALKFTTQIQPVVTSDAKTLDTPGLPDHLAARMDWQPPVGWVASFFDWLGKVDGGKDILAGVSWTNERKKTFWSQFETGIDAVLGGDEASFGVGLGSDHRWVIYVASQHSAAGKLSDLKDLADQLDAADEQAHNKPTVALSNIFVAGADDAQRLTFQSSGGSAVVLDSVVRGDTRYSTITPAPARELEKLLAVKSSGKLSVTADGWIDPQQLLELSAAVSDQVKPLSDDDRQLIAKVFSGQRISWTLSGQQQMLDASFELPMTMIKNLITNGQQLAEMASRHRPEPARN